MRQNFVGAPDDSRSRKQIAAFKIYMVALGSIESLGLAKKSNESSQIATKCGAGAIPLPMGPPTNPAIPEPTITIAISSRRNAAAWRHLSGRPQGDGPFFADAKPPAGI
jgi:hypothetical protein